MKTLALLLALTAFPVFGQEVINLSVAETRPNNAQYQVERLVLQYDNPSTPADEGSITIQLRGQNNESRSCTYSATTNPTATFLLNGLNKADLSSAYVGAGTGSLKQRIFHRLAVLGEGATVCGLPLTGVIAGTVP